MRCYKLFMRNFHSISPLVSSINATGTTKPDKDIFS